MEASNSSIQTSHKRAVSEASKILHLLPYERLVSILKRAFVDGPCSETFGGYANTIEGANEENTSSIFPNTEQAVEAAKRGDIKELQRHIRAMDMPNDEGEFPLTVAVSCNQFEVVQHLINWGCDPYVENRQSQTGSFLANVNKNLEIFEILQKHQTCFLGYEMGSFLRCAIEEKNHDRVIYLLEKNAPIGQYDSIGENAFHKAAKVGNVHIAKLLIKKAPNLVDSRTVYLGRTPLHVAVDSSHFKFAKYLIEEGRATINCYDKLGLTPGNLNEAAHNELDILVENEQIEAEGNQSLIRSQHKAKKRNVREEESLVEELLAVRQKVDINQKEEEEKEKEEGVPCSLISTDRVKNKEDQEGYESEDVA